MITPEQYPAIILNMCLLGFITFCYRYSFISRQGKKIAEKIPPNFLALLGPAVFTSIIANNILSNQSNPLEFKQKIFVVFAAFFVAYLTKNVVATLAFGLGLLYCLQNF